MECQVAAQLIEEKDEDVQLIEEQVSQNDLLQLITQPNFIVDLTQEDWESDDRAGPSSADNTQMQHAVPLERKELWLSSILCREKKKNPTTTDYPAARTMLLTGPRRKQTSGKEPVGQVITAKIRRRGVDKHHSLLTKRPRRKRNRCQSTVGMACRMMV